jgi:hypothetical protein
VAPGGGIVVAIGSGRSVVSCRGMSGGGGTDVVVLGGGRSVVVPWREWLPWFRVMVSKEGWEEGGMEYLPLP